ncbi:SufE family protein [Candidatus Carsonella ruddii]|uniref:SufE protein probably involved in Fe-S center assembly n=1 Tax=Candidatus Carsonella ruddii HC isolate Thao2000 TaxID=1202538 RepID=J3VPW2_CARRU|nr:SufE family protein [Candidatus Carsonella ruddii]AFP83951.1 SufE protein probably involved in Fe-S center assembly [Candidatus Carsonella ruddii HC isolate Thao2000]
MINKIKKIKKKIKFIKNIYIYLIKIGFQKKKFLNNNYLLKNCIINTWIKIIKKNFFFFFFGYSNSLLISGIIKIILKIINKNKLININIFYKFNFLKILKIKNISNFKLNSFKNIFIYIYTFINYNYNN